MKTLFDQHAARIADDAGNDELFIYPQELNEIAAKCALELKDVELADCGDHFELVGGYASQELDGQESPDQIARFEAILQHNIMLDGRIGIRAFVAPQERRFKVTFDYDTDIRLLDEGEETPEEANEFDAARSYGPHGFVPKESHDAPDASPVPEYEGPWHVVDEGSGGDILFEIRDVQGDLVAELRFDREPDWDEEAVVRQEQRYKANALLIAASTDTRDALEGMLTFFATYEDDYNEKPIAEFEKARKALAKANGEPR